MCEIQGKSCCTFNRIPFFFHAHLVSVCRPDKEWVMLSSCQVPIPQFSVDISLHRHDLKGFLTCYTHNKVNSLSFQVYIYPSPVPCVNYETRTQKCPVYSRLSGLVRGGLLHSLFHSSVERNTNEKQRRHSASVCSLVYSDSLYEECGGLAHELLITPFLGSVKFPQAHVQDLDTVPFWKTFNIPLFGEFLSPTYRTPHPPLCETEKWKVLWEKQSEHDGVGTTAKRKEK